MEEAKKIKQDTEELSKIIKNCFPYLRSCENVI